jgi:hypothetical protein
MPNQDKPVTRAHEARHLLAQRGLADARLTSEHDQGTVTSGSGLEGSVQLLQLERAADERRPSACQDVAYLLLDRLAGPTCSCVCRHALYGAL